MTAPDLDLPLRESLLRWAAGSRGTTAAIQLLLHHGFLPERLDQLEVGGYLERVGEEYARINFRRLARDIDEGIERLGYDLSSSEEAVVLIAASLAGKHAVNLSYALGVLDVTNARLVREAIARATGVDPR